MPGILVLSCGHIATFLVPQELQPTNGVEGIMRIICSLFGYLPPYIILLIICSAQLSSGPPRGEDQICAIRIQYVDHEKVLYFLH